jgi:SRSO17 transposase
VYRSKWRIGLGQIERARRNGLFLEWLTFDEGYGGKPPFLRELDRIGQKYVGEVPSSFTVWTIRPEVLHREHASDRFGRPRKFPRLKRKNNPRVEVRHVASYSPLFRRQDWQAYHVKDGHKGPMVWNAKRLRVWMEDDQGLPTRPYHLLVTFNVLEPEKIKYFISNGPEDTPVETLLKVAFSRWKIERMFEDGKSELGMDHFEVRKFRSIQRHLILSCVSYLFLAEFHQAHRGEKTEPDGLPGPHRDQPLGAHLDSWRPLLPGACRTDRSPIAPHPTAHRQERPQPSQDDPAAFARNRAVSREPTHVSMEPLVAL